MRFLDRLMEVVNNASKQEGGNPALLEGVVDLLRNRGIGGILEDFKQRGLGEVVSSWVGTGANQLISPEQIKAALGDERLLQLAQKAGVSSENASRFLNDVLPGLVDRLTPGGELPVDDPSLPGSGPPTEFARGSDS